MALRDVIAWFTGNGSAAPEITNSPDTWPKTIAKRDRQRSSFGKKTTAVQWQSKSSSVPDPEADAFFDDARRRIDGMREEFWTNKDNLRELLTARMDGDGNAMPGVKIDETSREYNVTLDLPGFAENEVQLQVGDDQLTVVGERSESQASDAHNSEQFYRRFQQTIPFAAPIDRTKIKSKLEGGVLRVTLFKTGR